METDEVFEVTESWENLFKKLRMNSIDSWEPEVDGRYPGLGDGPLAENERTKYDQHRYRITRTIQLLLSRPQINRQTEEDDNDDRYDGSLSLSEHPEYGYQHRNTYMDAIDRQVEIYDWFYNFGT